MSQPGRFGAALRDVLVVARFDLAESLRSRRALIFLVLYVAGATGGVVLFTEVLQTVEEPLAEQLLVARTDQPGSLTEAVMQSQELLDVLSRLVGSSSLAETLLGLPPVALVYPVRDAGRVILSAGRCVKTGPVDQVTERGHVVSVRLAGPIDLADVGDLVERREPALAGDWLSYHLLPDEVPAECHAELLPALLRRGVRVLEVKLGRSLEEVYIESRAVAPRDRSS